MTSSCFSEPASFTAASQSLRPRYRPEHALPAVNLASPWIELVVLIDQFLTEWIADVLVVVEATVQTLHVCGWHQVQEVLVEVRAD